MSIRDAVRGNGLSCWRRRSAADTALQAAEALTPPKNGPKSDRDTRVGRLYRYGSTVAHWSSPMAPLAIGRLQSSRLGCGGADQFQRSEEVRIADAELKARRAEPERIGETVDIDHNAVDAPAVARVVGERGRFARKQCLLVRGNGVVVSRVRSRVVAVEVGLVVEDVATDHGPARRCGYGKDVVRVVFVGTSTTGGGAIGVVLPPRRGTHRPENTSVTYA